MKTTVTELLAWTQFGPNPMDTRSAGFSSFDHGSAVAAMISGPKLGICKNCQVRFVTTAYWRKGDTWEKWARLGERVLAPRRKSARAARDSNRGDQAGKAGRPGGGEHEL